MLGAEQGLEDFETCALGEIFLPNFTSYEELRDAVTLLYRVVKHSLALPAKGLEETQQVVNTNMRMGLGMTGIFQATDEQLSWMEPLYEDLRKFDKEYSPLHGFPESIKLTTVKPSGTLSLLPGVTPGAHPAYSKYLIRRVRIAAGHELVKVARDHGYHVEPQRKFDGTNDPTTMVIEFPFTHGEHAIESEDVSMLTQLAMIKKLQTEWSDNSVSCTVYYRPEELDTLKQYLYDNFADNHKTLSFLLHSGHGFDQAPYEPITKEQYEQLVSKTTMITSLNDNMDMDGSDCEAGVCPIR